MFKRKRKPSEYDDDFPPPLPIEYGGELVDSSIKKRKQRCVFTLVGVVMLLVCGFVGYKAYQRNDAMRPLPTPTFPPDDGQPVPVDSGLVFAEYAVNGQQTGVYDLDGQPITSPDNIPISLPVSTAENPLEGLNAIAYPDGAFYDASSGQLVVFGPPSQAGVSTSRDDFLTALLTVYAGGYPGISIDPTGSETVQNVRYIGQTDNTHFGWVMFEADRLMKTFSMGQDNITGASVTSSVPGFANLFDLELQLGSQNQNEVRRRFWLKVPSVEIEQTPDGQGMFITVLSLEVDTEYLDANWQTARSQQPDPAGQAFAAHLTDHYDEYAVEFPVFNDLKSMAHWTAFVHWLQQADLPIQPELWLTDSPTSYADAPLTTPAITATRQSQQGNIIRTLLLWGGVSLDMTPKILPAQEATLGRLQEIITKFKAWTGFANVEFAGQGISYSSISTSQIKQDSVSTLELPLFGVPALQRASNKWTLRLPHLMHDETGQTSIFLFDDPSSTQLVVLSYQGLDSETSTDVFGNEERGLRLAMYADGYQLLFGEFQNEQFSYYEDDFMFFDLQGNILEDMKTGTSYDYSEGVLAHIRQGSNDLTTFLDQDNRIQQLKSAEGEVNFIYDNGLLISIHDANGQAIRAFVYEDGRLVSEIGVNGGVDEKIHYDEQGRVLYQIIDNNPSLYDWHEDGTLTLVSGKALLPWHNAEIKDLEDLRVMFRLMRRNVTEQMLFTRRVDDKLVVMLNGKSYTLPADMLKSPAVLRRKLTSVLGQGQVSGEMMLISSGNVQGVSFQSLFKTSILLTAETMDEVRIARNVEFLRKTPQGFDTQNASIINAVPKPEDATAVKSNSGVWHIEPGNMSSQTWKSFFDDLIAQPEIAIPTRPATNEQMKKALSEDLSVLIVVAHSDGQDIYLPNGMKFNPDKLSPEEKIKITQKNPLVILLSCDTAAPSGNDASFAHKLLETGPRVVIAPSGKLKVSDAYDILEFFLKDPLSKTDALQSFFEAIKIVYPDFLIPDNEDGVDHSFYFHVQTIQPSSQENTT